MAEIDEQQSGAVKERERAHFGGEGVYLLSFLERDGGAFGRFIIRWTLKVWDRHLAFARPEWLLGRDALDASCGNPRSVAWFAQMGARLAAGCDISAAMLRRGLERGRAWAFGREMAPAKNIFAADSERLPLRDASFDTIFIMQSLHHLDQAAFFAEAARTLRPGGVLFISEPNGGHPLRRVADRVGRAAGVMSRDERARPPAEITAGLRAAGFRIAETHAMNFLAELYFLFTALVELRSPALAAALRLGLIPLHAMDLLLEKTIGRLLPSLAWRIVIVGVKNT